MQRTSSFVADGITPGFTVRYAHPPRSPQHLTHGLAALHVLRLSLSFGPSRSPSGLVGLVLPLLRPLLTSRSGTSRRPFRHKARSPQVRTHTFIAQPPHLRHLALVTRALWFCAHSPCLATPSMRLLFISSRFTRHASFPRSVTLTQLHNTQAHCEQLAAGLAPAGVCPCLAHDRHRGPSRWKAPLPHHPACGSAPGGSSA
jgi:hypothetical protein